MIINKGEKIHVIYRALYEDSARCHFLGEVQFAEGAICRALGYMFVYDKNKSEFLKKPDKRISIIDLADIGCIATILNSEVKLENVVYTYAKNVGLIATDHKNFTLNINEFSARS